jgi:hypothetical protein
LNKSGGGLEVVTIACWPDKVKGGYQFARSSILVRMRFSGGHPQTSSPPWLSVCTRLRTHEQKALVCREQMRAWQVMLMQIEDHDSSGTKIGAPSFAGINSSESAVAADETDTVPQTSTDSKYAEGV